MTPNEYKAILQKMSEEEFSAFRKQFGGDHSRERYVSEFQQRPAHEHMLCDILQVPTEAEKMNLASEANHKATLEAVLVVRQVLILG